jgi:DNA-binding transcriptional LysR family regulator
VKSEPKNQLHRVDLNLLVELDTLLRERNVTNAAKTLFVSQSAMSRSLKKLRETFNDPLFIRTASGLTPTSKALELGKELQLILPLLSHLFNKNQFTPSDCKDTFSLSVPAFIGSRILPDLILGLMAEAPDVNLIEVPAKSNPYDLLDKGKLDFAIHYSKSLDQKYQSTKIGSIYPKLFVRHDHPIANSQASLEKVIEFPILAMTIEEDHKQAFNTPFQKLLSRYNSDNSPKLRSAQTTILMQVAANSDAVLFGMNALSAVSEFERDFVCVHDFKDDEEYHVDLYMLQHQRSVTSSSHQWLAGKIIDSVQAML